MRLLYLAAFWLAGICLGLAVDARPWAAFLLFLATIPIGFLVYLAKRSLGPVVLAGLLLLAFWRVEAAQQPISPPYFLGQQQAVVTGRVVDDPEARSRNIRFTLAVDTIDLGSGPQEVSSRILVYAEPPPSLVSRREAPFFQYGDRMTAAGLLRRPKPFQGFDYPAYLESKGVSGVLWAREAQTETADQGGMVDSARRGIFTFRGYLARSLNRNLTARQSALAQPLLLGLRGQLPPDVVDDFRDTGASHLLAISGLHVGVMMLLVMGLVSGTIGRGRHVYWLAPLVVIWIYALTSGLPLSVVRAAMMGSTVLAAVALGRPRRVLPALAMAAAVMAGIDPRVLSQASFQLSFAAVAGIALVLPLQPGLAEVVSKRIGSVHDVAWPRIWVARAAVWLATALLVSVAATLATWPLVAYNFQRIPWMGIPVTVLALPILPFALMGSLATAFGGSIHPAAGQLFGWMAWAPLTYLLKLTSMAPHTTTEDSWVGVPFLAVWYGLLALGLMLPGGLPRLIQAAPLLGGRRDKNPMEPDPAPSPDCMRMPGRISKLWLGLAVLGLGAAGILWWQVLSGPSGELQVYFFDVGQGDSALIVTPQGRQVLIDGGPDSQGAVQAVGAELSFWDKSLDLVVLTHLDADHSRGLIEVLDRYQVGGVLTGSDSVEAPLRARWGAALEQAGLAAIKVESGYRIDIEPGSDPPLFLEVLNPQRDRARPSPADSNNNAVVLRLVYGEVSFLLSSDVEAPAEAAIARGGATLNSTLLKVAPQGSKTSTTSSFLRRIDPEFAVISVGEGNSYGHPNPAVLSRLQETVDSEKLFRTDLHGTIEAVSDGVKLWVITGDR